MITKSENLQKLKNRNIFEEIKNKVSPIKDTTKTPDTNSDNMDYTRVADDILNENWQRKNRSDFATVYFFKMYSSVSNAL